MNQLISNCLGIRQDGGDLVIDPVLPRELDGLRFDFMVNGCNVQFEYRLSGSSAAQVTINGQAVAAEAVSNRYREGGVRINRQQLNELLKDQQNLIVIQL